MQCRNQASYRFTWPGRDESFICREHVDQLRGVANAIGLPLQIIPLSFPDAHLCRQEIKETNHEPRKRTA